MTLLPGAAAAETAPVSPPARARGDVPLHERARIAGRPAGTTAGLRFRSTPDRYEGTDGDDRVGGFRLGWKASALLTLIMLTGPIGLVVALPPLLDCRERAERFGFYTGDTLMKCTRRGIDARLQRLDARLKMLVRGSGR